MENLGVRLTQLENGQQRLEIKMNEVLEAGKDNNKRLTMLENLEIARAARSDIEERRGMRNERILMWFGGLSIPVIITGLVSLTIMWFTVQRIDNYGPRNNDQLIQQLQQVLKEKP